jgi:hypothetical protein
VRLQPFAATAMRHVAAHTSCLIRAWPDHGLSGGKQVLGVSKIGLVSVPVVAWMVRYRVATFAIQVCYA